MDKPIRVLVVEDSEDDVELLLRTLRRNGYAPDFERVDTPDTMREALERREWDIILSDYSMPKFSAPAALHLLKSRGIDLPFLIVSGTIGEEAAVTALRSGANDFLTKMNLARLVPAIERELQEAANRRERRKAEAEVYRREQQFRALAENAPDIIARYDRDLRHVYVNSAVERALGIPPDKLIGKTFQEVGVPSDVESVWREGLERVFATGQEHSIEFDYPGPDGVRHYQARLAPELAPDGSIESVMSIARDLTDQKRADRALASTQEHIEDLYVRLQGAMIETHHRVKNNLQVIAAMIDLRLAEDTESVPAEELRRLGRHVRALAVAHDILTHEARHDRQAHFLSAGEMLTKLLELIKQSSGGRPIEMEIDDVRIPVRQATSLALVLNELIGNALKHAHGTITVNLRSKDGASILEVSDEGPGFPPDFEPAESANTGLELVNMLSRWDLGGEALYANGPDGGARVQIAIPMSDPDR